MMKSTSRQKMPTTSNNYSRRYVVPEVRVTHFLDFEKSYAISRNRVHNFWLFYRGECVLPLYCIHESFIAVVHVFFFEVRRNSFHSTLPEGGRAHGVGLW